MEDDTVKGSFQPSFGANVGQGKSVRRQHVGRLTINFDDMYPILDIFSKKATC
jgi:hypothetical protein